MDINVTMAAKNGRYLILADSTEFLFALALEDVVEIMRPQPVRPVAGLPKFVAGASMIRGATTPVLNLSQLWTGNEACVPGRFVAVQAGERRVVIAVESVVGVRSIAPELFSELPPLLRGADAEAVAALGEADSQILLILESARLLPDEIWHAMDARGMA